MKILTWLALASLFIFNSLDISAQRPKRYNSSEIFKKMQKLNVLGNALYIAAHPDDENTRLITYLSNASLINTAYLSLTRGDGGQNSIGPEQSELLGVIRTQELLSARGVDGGSQYFTRVMDFGYSKSAEETLNIWNKDEILYDVVWVIRKFRPDVIITRFPADHRAGHGQHEISAIVADEAFEMAADPTIFPDQLEYVDVWQPDRLLLNTGRWWNPDIGESEGVTSVDIGEYDPLSGLSYSELGADSRSQHKSQAFGVTWRRGESKEFLEYIKGSKPESGIFDGIDISWNRIGRKDIEEVVSGLIQNYNFENPSKNIDACLKLRTLIETVEEENWKIKKLKELDDIIKSCLGIYLETTSDHSYMSPGDEVTFNMEMTNRSDLEVNIRHISSSSLKYDTLLQETLVYNQPLKINTKKTIPDGINETSPFWLKTPQENYRYQIDDPADYGRAISSESLVFDIGVEVKGQFISFEIPVTYTWTDRMAGQQYKSLEIGPRLFVDIVEKVLIYPDNNGKNVNINITTRNQPAKGILHLKLPEGWMTVPQQINFDLDQNESADFRFILNPPEAPSTGKITAIASIESHEYDRRLVEVSYDHFPKQAVYLPSEAEIVKLDIQKKGDRLAYIQGAGDDVGASLEQIGYEVIYVNELNIHSVDFKSFDAIVFGIMAFNNNAYLAEYSQNILDFVDGGGTVIVQYNNIRIGTKSPIIHPYPIEFSGSSARVRVSVEDAEVRFIDPENPVLNYPNKITSMDFDNWVQERGLYFPVSWDEQYTPVLSSNDPGEDPLNGGLLVAKSGKGYYIYTTYAWFRQLPAGVPGAYRIFANMLSIGR